MHDVIAIDRESDGARIKFNCTPILRLRVVSLRLRFSVVRTVFFSPDRIARRIRVARLRVNHGHTIQISYLDLGRSTLQQHIETLNNLHGFDALLRAAPSIF